MSRGILSSLALVVLGGETWLFCWVAERHFQWHRTRAEELSASFQHDEAARHAARAAAFHRRDGRIRLLAARLLRRAELPTEAQPHLETARRRLGDHPDVELEQLLLAVQLGHASELVESSLYRRAQRDVAHRALILEALAVAALASYRIDKARALLDEWLQDGSPDPRPYFWRGLALQQMGGYQEDAALADFRRAVQLHPDYDEARRRLGLLLVKKNAHAEAGSHFKQLLARNENDVTAWVGLAKVEAAAGANETARTYLQKALQLQGDSVDALRELGILTLNEGNAEGALPLLARAYQLDPSDPYTSYNLFRCYQQLGRESEAQQQKAQHEALAARHERTLKLLAELQSRPHDADLLHELGTLYLQAGRADAEATGLWFLQRALTASPRHQATLQTLARYYESKGRKDLALEFLRRLKPY